MCDLKWVRQYLADEVATLKVNALVSSHLDCCNSVFRTPSNFNLCKLECIQNTLAKIVRKCNRYTEIFYSQNTPFVSNLSICCGRYGTLDIPQFYPSEHKSQKHLGHSFAFDAVTLWND